MSILKRSDDPSAGKPGVVGTARFSRPDAELSAALRPGDVAVINQADLDRDTADRLLAAGVCAVVNVAASSTGRFPNLGPQVLADAGVPLVDSVGETLLAKLRSGDRLRVHDGQIFRDEVLIGSGAEYDSTRAAATIEQASTGLTSKLDTLAANASDHLRREHALLLEGARIPRLTTRLKGRPAVVVSQAHAAKSDLAGLKRFIADNNPVLIGAGAGATVLLDAGYQPHVVVGAANSLPAAAVAKAGEVVVTTGSGHIESPERFEKHGRELVRFVADGDDTDLALLLADESQASVIVHAGAPPSLVDLLDRDAGLGGASFVVRLRAGAKIVDAKAVRHITSGHFPLWPAVLLMGAGFVALFTALASSATGAAWLADVADGVGASVGGLLGDVATWIKGLFS